MGIVRPVMEQHPWAWCFFIPFIFMATFTILNLFIGIIVSTMQDLSRKEGHEGSAVASIPPGGIASDQAALPSRPSLTAARSPLVATSLAAPLPLRPRRGRRRARPLL